VKKVPIITHSAFLPFDVYYSAITDGVSRSDWEMIPDELHVLVVDHDFLDIPGIIIRCFAGPKPSVFDWGLTA
jgi:hypothetical protein